jgi:Tfp pilus assembly protein PilO
MSELISQDTYHRFRKYYRSIEPIIAKPKTRIYTTVVLTFLAISLFAWYAIKPTIETIIMLQKEITDKTAVNKQMEDKISNLIEAQSNYQQVQNLVPLITEATPENPDVIDVVSQIRNLIQSTQATAAAFQVSETPLISSEAIKAKKIKADGSLDEFTISSAITGNFADLEKVLTGLTSMRRIVTIELYNISPWAEESQVKNASGSSMLRMTILLKSYFQPG